MNTQTQLQLIKLNNAFYHTHAASFSATRKRPWDGWQQIARLTQTEFVTHALIERRPVRVLDVACGNLRFEHFLTEALPRDHFAFSAVDSCDELAGEPLDTITFIHDDVLCHLMEHTTASSWNTLGVDLTVCFGFMHHVPGEILRQMLLEELVRATRPGGIIVCSYWQFMDDERLANKVAAMEMQLDRIPTLNNLDRTQLEMGDHFLGWQDDNTVPRFCHQIDEAELDRLVHSLTTPVEELMRFNADGKSGKLNRYSVLRRLS